MKNGLEIDSHGNKSWWLNDVLHRDNGPAVEWINGHKSWWLNGKKVHRTTLYKQSPKISKFKEIHRCPGFKAECPKKSWIKLGNKFCEDCKKLTLKPVPQPKIDVPRAVEYVNKKKRKIKFLTKDLNMQKVIKKLKKVKPDKKFIR